MIGTAAMTCLEAKTNDDVKQLLVDTPGIPEDSGVEGGWAASGGAGGMAMRRTRKDSSAPRGRAMVSARVSRLRSAASRVTPR